VMEMIVDSGDGDDECRFWLRRWWCWFRARRWWWTIGVNLEITVILGITVRLDEKR
jgi:hypothetical protein